MRIFQPLSVTNLPLSVSLSPSSPSLSLSISLPLSLSLSFPLSLSPPGARQEAQSYNCCTRQTQLLGLCGSGQAWVGAGGSVGGPYRALCWPVACNDRQRGRQHGAGGGRHVCRSGGKGAQKREGEFALYGRFKERCQLPGQIRKDRVDKRKTMLHHRRRHVRVR